MRFAPEYVTCVLNENFEDAKAQFLAPLMRIHYAHLVMLREQGIVSPADAGAIRGGARFDLHGGSPPGGLRRHLRGSVLLRRAADRGCLRRRRRGTAAHGALAQRHRHDDVPDAAARPHPVACCERSLRLRRVLLELAGQHRESVFAAHTHTQPAQPSTVAHYLLAVVEQLERDAARLKAAYASTNRNPLGACAITGHRLPDRSGAHHRCCWVSTGTPATPTAASRRSTTCSKASRRPPSCSSGSAACSRISCSGAPASSATCGWPTASCSAAASCRRSATRWRWSTRARSRARRSARPTRSSPRSTTRRSATSSTPKTICSRSCSRRSGMPREPWGWWRRRCRRRSSTRGAWPSAPAQGWITVTELADTLTREHGVSVQTEPRDRDRAGAGGHPPPGRARSSASSRDVRRRCSAGAIELARRGPWRGAQPRSISSACATTPGGPAPRGDRARACADVRWRGSPRDCRGMAATRETVDGCRGRRNAPQAAACRRL